MGGRRRHQSAAHRLARLCACVWVWVFLLAGPGLAADDDAHGGWRRFPFFSLMTKKETGGKRKKKKAIYVLSWDSTRMNASFL